MLAATGGGCQAWLVRSSRLILLAALVAASTLAASAAVGSAVADRQATSCRTEAARVAYRAGSMVRHYSGMVYPADVEYMLLRNSFRRFQARRCPPASLGRALRDELPARRRARLLELLPAQMSRTFRRALAAARR